MTNYHSSGIFCFMMEKFAGPRMPELSPASQALIYDAAQFALEGQLSDALHPEIEREKCFPDFTIMPVQELPPSERGAVVAMAVSQSLNRTLIDAVHDWDGITKVNNPRAYYDLLKTGKKIEELNVRKGPLFDEADYEADSIKPHIVAGVVYKEFARLAEQLPGGIKRGLEILKDAQPKLSDSETRTTRHNDRMLDKKRMLFRWRYGRTLAVAGAAGAFAIASLLCAKSVEHKNAPRIASIEHDRQATYSETPADVRKVVDVFLNDVKATALLNQNSQTIASAQTVAKHIDTLNTEADNLKQQSSEKNNNALLLGVLSIGAFGRFGLWRLQRPKRANDK